MRYAGWVGLRGSESEIAFAPRAGPWWRGRGMPDLVKGMSLRYRNWTGLIFVEKSRASVILTSVDRLNQKTNCSPEQLSMTIKLILIVSLLN